MMAALADKAAVETVLTLGAEDFVADCAGALWWDAAATLVVSDLHLEKGSSFATRGQFLPPYDTGVTLAALAALIARYRPRRVVALATVFTMVPGRRGWRRTIGRFLPVSSAASTGCGSPAITIRTCRASLRRPCQSVGRGWALLHPRAEPQAHGAGNRRPSHPCAKIRGRGRTVRRRAFVHDGQRLIMPAMGTYAGGLNLRDPAISTAVS